MKKFLPLVASVLFFLLGLVLKGPASDPDTQFGIGREIGVFLVFISWSINLFQWGSLFSYLFRLDDLFPVSPFMLGTLWAVTVMGLLGSVGGIGHDLFGVHCFILFLGSILNRYVRANKTSQHFTPVKLVWPFVLFLSLLLIIEFLAAATPQGHTDPLFYHLLAPKLWSDAGRVYYDQHNPLLFNASYWEYLYLWANSFVGAEGKFGLIEVQLFCQWIHVLFGLGATAIGLFILFSREQKDQIWLCLWVVAGLLTGSTFWVAVLAKNDWGLIFWCLCGVLLVLGDSKKNKDMPFLGGIFFGLSGASKLSNLYFIFGFLSSVLIWEISVHKKKLTLNSFGKSPVLIVGYGMLIGAIPLWMRNFLATGNPFYPMLNRLFGTLIPGIDDVTKHIFVSYSTVNLDHYRWIFMSLIRENPFVILLLALPLFLFSKKTTTSKSSQMRILSCTLGVVAFVYILSIGKETAWRYSGLFIVLLGSFTAYGISRVKLWPSRVGQLICGLVILFQINHVKLLQMPQVFEKDSAEAIRAHLGGDSKAWLRLHAQKSEVIVSAYDPQIYYLASMPVRLLEFDPELNRATARAESARDICGVILKLNARYLFESWFLEDGGNPFGRNMFILRSLLEKHLETIVFRGATSSVIDARALCHFAMNEPEKKVNTSDVENVFKP